MILIRVKLLYLRNYNVFDEVLDGLFVNHYLGYKHCRGISVLRARLKRDNINIGRNERD